MENPNLEKLAKKILRKLNDAIESTKKDAGTFSESEVLAAVSAALAACVASVISATPIKHGVPFNKWRRHYMQQFTNSVVHISKQLEKEGGTHHE